MTSTRLTAAEILRQTGLHASSSGQFGEMSCSDTRLSLRARGCDAEYRLDHAGGEWIVSFVTPDRWLSESIETDLLHTGDPIEELIEEELAELGERGAKVAVKHFRSDDRLYTFSAPLSRPKQAPAGADEETVRHASTYLRAFEAAFSALGDVAGSRRARPPAGEWGTTCWRHLVTSSSDHDEYV